MKKHGTRGAGAIVEAVRTAAAGLASALREAENRQDREQVFRLINGFAELLAREEAVAASISLHSVRGRTE